MFLPAATSEKVQFMRAETVGDVYCFGFGKHGQVHSFCGLIHLEQLGQGNFNSQSSPRIIQPLAGKQIVKIACGGAHTVAGISHTVTSSEQIQSLPKERFTFGVMEGMERDSLPSRNWWWN